MEEIARAKALRRDQCDSRESSVPGAERSSGHEGDEFQSGDPHGEPAGHRKDFGFIL